MCIRDRYDTDGSSSGAGSWELMANSWGFDGSQHYPPHFSASSKISLGWMTSRTIVTPGQYMLHQAEERPECWRIDRGYPAGEYLLIENRQPYGFDEDMPQGGLCIWHVDEAKAGNDDEGHPQQAGWPGNNRHYRLALLQADGRFDLERDGNRGDGADAWRAGGADRLDDSTLPNLSGYQGGTVQPTGDHIFRISRAEPEMSFWYGPHLPPEVHCRPVPTLQCNGDGGRHVTLWFDCLLYTSPSPRDS